jgi:hypothetical protein
VVSGQWSVTARASGPCSFFDCAPGDGNSLQRAGLSALCDTGAAAWKRPLAWEYADLEDDLRARKQTDSLQIGKKVALQMVIKS